ncbi:MAG: PBP1A family penicillin-binding protein [Patescibacteria group bacterium]|nr:PBP1A family penicillin-binding protein [Patescibacteria group bacterium]
MIHSTRRERVKKLYQRQKLLLKLFFLLTGFFLFAFIVSLIVFAWYAKDLPSPGKLSQATTSSTIFYDREEKILFELYKDKNRVPVKLSDVSSDFKNAVVAIEDKKFYHHRGISQTGILRAFFNIIFKRKIEGGSTITQQLIKNVLLTPQRTASRKIKEMLLAFEVERRYSKDQILEMYINEAPFGGTFWGVGAAANGYFDKSPKDLTLVEAAFLAGLPQSPSYYSPFIGKKDAWKDRTKAVLRRMYEDKYIDKKQYQEALIKMEKLKFTTPKLAINAPHFVFYVRDWLEKEYSSKILDQGVKIKTTLSLETQKIAEKIVKEEINKIKNLNVTNAAVIILDAKTGEILSMVGSYDFNDEKFGKFNAALGLRQPGSTLKPITYAVAFEKGYTPATVLMDVKTEFTSGKTNEPAYIPVNYDGKFRGPMQIRFALGNSENIPAVKMLAMIGIKDFLQKAYEMGISQFVPTDNNLNRFGLSITLGGGETTLLELTSAFSVFANGGIKKEISSINTVTDYKGKTLFKKVKTKEKQVLSAEASFLISHILSDNNSRLEVFGSHSYLNIPGKTVAVKTGTSDDKRDNWAVGYTKSVVVGVWVGNNDNSKMDPKIASGATGASPIFYRLMTELLKKYPDGIMDKPAKVKAMIIDAYLGGLPKDGYPTRSEYFIDGTEPKDISPFYKKLKISKSNGKLANELEIKTGNYEEKEFIVITENDPLSLDGKNRWQEAIDAWAKEQKEEKYHPPTEVSDTNSDLVIVSIKSPSDKQTLTNSNVSLKAKIATLYPLKNIKIYLNDEEIRNYNEDKKEIDEEINLADGVYEIKIRAVNEKDKVGESSVKFGINKPWDYVMPKVMVSPTPTNLPSPTPTITE